MPIINVNVVIKQELILSDKWQRGLNQLKYVLIVCASLVVSW
jgi:hypothetical protein